MRGMPFPKEWSASTQHTFKTVYAALQFIATSAVMLNTNQYTLLLSAIPVQLAAFLMTCVRKSIMSAKVRNGGAKAGLTLVRILA